VAWDVGEVVVPFHVSPDRVRLGTEFKSTWLRASLDALRDHRHFERYVTLLPREHHEAVLQSVAAMWLPMSVAMAHYAACEALGLSTTEQMAMGKVVFKRLERTIFSFAFHAAREVGVTPWSTLKAIPAALTREMRGGASAIYKVGPKDARIEIIGFPCCCFAYCRAALRGMAVGLCELVCKKAFAHEVRELCSDTRVAYRVAWA
jgi:hypothetical protein